MFRKAIRDAAKARIISEMPTDFEEVSIGRRTAIPRAKLPACCIYTDGEEIEVMTVSSPRILERRLDLKIKIVVAEGSGSLADDVLDALAYSVEDALTSSDKLGISYVENIIPAEWEVEAEEEGADDKYLSGTVTFTCIYQTQEVTA